MNANPRNPAAPDTTANGGTNWIARQAEAVRCEALAVEYEARTLEIEAGGVVPPFPPPPFPPVPVPPIDPTVDSLAAEARALARDSKLVLSRLPADSEDWAMVDSIHRAAKDFYEKAQAEHADATSMHELVDEAQALADEGAALLDTLSDSHRALVENLRKHLKSFCDQVAASGRTSAD